MAATVSAAVAMGMDKGGTKTQNRQENQTGKQGDP
jgi:negative regulator of sigma E activity